MYHYHVDCGNLVKNMQVSKSCHCELWLQILFSATRPWVTGWDTQLQSTHCTVHNEHCNLHAVQTAHCILDIAISTLHKTYWTLHTVHITRTAYYTLQSPHCECAHCILNIPHCAFSHCAHCILNITCTLRSAHCILNIAISTHCNLHTAQDILNITHCAHCAHCMLNIATCTTQCTNALFWTHCIIQTQGAAELLVGFIFLWCWSKCIRAKRTIWWRLRWWFCEAGSFHVKLFHCALFANVHQCHTLLHLS